MLKTLQLENFRNYQKYYLDFDRITVLVGPNGIGKTNLIEALYLLATGRSWRVSRETETILWGAPFARLKIKTNTLDSQEVELILQRQPTPKFSQIKMVKINGVKKKLSQILGVHNVVLFSPEELQMVSGSPSLRRRDLDILLCQLDMKYTRVLLELAKIIRGRNRLLYYIKLGKSQIKELVFWDEKLVELGGLIIQKRTEALKSLNQKIGLVYQMLAAKNELKIKYRPSVKASDFKETLQNNQSREIENCLTLFGPHRDDFVFMLDGKNLSAFGSRGEFRSAVLALKVSELRHLEEAGREPILLLDDIFSELDKNRRQALAEVVKNQQTVITTTDLDHLEKGLREKAKIVELK